MAKRSAVPTEAGGSGPATGAGQPRLSVLQYGGDMPTSERLLVAAARLFATRGFHEVSIYDIAGELGLSGAALYRHYESKSMLLVALCERVADRVVADGMELVRRRLSDAEILAGLIEGQLQMAIEDRDVLVTYLQERGGLPPDDRRRLRRKQRLYLEEWFHVVSGLRPDLSEREVEALVRAAIAVIHSAADYEPALSPDRAAEVLGSAAYRVLGVDRVAR